MSTHSARPSGGERTSEQTAVRTALDALLARGDLELPLLPGVAAEVLSSSLDDQTDAARLAQLIQQDQALAGHVLRIVNSPAFRGAIEIVALRQAIARLGMERIREIALSASLSGAVFRRNDYPGLAERAWRLALCAGLWAKEVARACRRNVEIGYLCGLLHNVGAPLVLSAVAKVAPGGLAEPVVAELVDACGAAAGVLLARAWKLPEPVVATVEHVGDFRAAGAHRDAVAVAAGGVHIARAMLAGPLLAAEVSAASPIQHLNLYPDHVDGILAARDTVRASMESMAA